MTIRKLAKNFEPGEAAVFDLVGKHTRQQEATYLDFPGSTLGGAVAYWDDWPEIRQLRKGEVVRVTAVRLAEPNKYRPAVVGGTLFEELEHGVLVIVPSGLEAMSLDVASYDGRSR